MNLFSTLCFEITSDCNRKCEFCPVAYNKRPTEAMHLMDIEAAADELASLKYAGRVELYIYNEPLKQRDALYVAVEAFRMRCPRATLMIATNGDYLKGVKDLEDLFARGVQQIVLNAYTKKQVPRFKSWIGELLDTTDDVYRALPRGRRAIKMYDKCDPTTFGQGVFSLQNRAGNVPTMACVVEPLNRMCVKPFRLLNINWRGEALICCNDYHGDVLAGRFPETTLEDIWNGPVLNAYRAKLIRKDRSLPLCRSCDCHAGAYAHAVDAVIGDVATDASIEAAYDQRVSARAGALIPMRKKVVL